jgi:hypothetical protein
LWRRRGGSIKPVDTRASRKPVPPRENHVKRIVRWGMPYARSDADAGWDGWGSASTHRGRTSRCCRAHHSRRACRRCLSKRPLAVTDPYRPNLAQKVTKAKMHENTQEKVYEAAPCLGEARQSSRARRNTKETSRHVPRYHAQTHPCNGQNNSDATKTKYIKIQKPNHGTTATTPNHARNDGEEHKTARNRRKYTTTPSPQQLTVGRIRYRAILTLSEIDAPHMRADPRVRHRLNSSSW